MSWLGFESDRKLGILFTDDTLDNTSPFTIVRYGLVVSRVLKRDSEEVYNRVDW